MYYRALGHTQIQVSEVGFGSWAIGGDAWGHVDDAESVRAIHRALELGVNFIDTADVYGNGRSESLVGKAITGRRDAVVVSTKGGLMGHHRDPDREPVYDRPERVLEAFDASLRRLGTDYIDVYWCHIWWDKHEETEAFLVAFDTLKRAGKVRAVGVSTDSIDHIRHFVRDRVIDAVQFDYSVLNRSAEADILPFIEEHGLGAVVRGPLYKGMLSGKFTSATTFAEGDIRHDWPSQPSYQTNLDKVQRLGTVAGRDRSVAELALRFVLSNSAISVAIPGAKTVSQVEQNVRASIRPLLSAEDLSAIDRIAVAE
jgi:aryl-alcohol dehydrogenase-like predicted oxidoreductase